MHPVFLQIGSFELASYGLMTALGYAAAALYLLPRLKKIGLDKDTFWNLIFIAFMGALAGSKLLYIVVSWPQLGATLAEKLTNIVRDFRYGFVFFGGMIVSVGALVWYIRRKGLPQKRQVVRLLGRINQGELCVAVEAGDEDTGPVRRVLYRVQVLVCPAPEFYAGKAVVFSRLEAVQEGKLRIHRLDTCGFEKFHSYHRLFILCITHFVLCTI